MTPDLILPQPSNSELVELQSQLAKSASEMATVFGLADGRRWREMISGDRLMDAYRYSLTLLSLGLHPHYKAGRKPTR